MYRRRSIRAVASSQARSLQMKQVISWPPAHCTLPVQSDETISPIDVISADTRNSAAVERSTLDTPVGSSTGHSRNEHNEGARPMSPPKIRKDRRRAVTASTAWLVGP